MIKVTIEFETYAEAADFLAGQDDSPAAASPEKPNSGKPRGRPRKDAVVIAPEAAAPSPAAPAAQAPAAAPAAQAPAAPAQPAAPPADVQAAYRAMAEPLSDLMEKDWDACKALLKSFGAETAKDLKPEQYAAVTEAAKKVLAPPRAALI